MSGVAACCCLGFLGPARSNGPASTRLCFGFFARGSAFDRRFRRSGNRCHIDIGNRIDGVTTLFIRTANTTATGSTEATTRLVVLSTLGTGLMDLIYDLVLDRFGAIAMTIQLYNRHVLDEGLGGICGHDVDGTRSTFILIAAFTTIDTVAAFGSVWTIVPFGPISPLRPIWPIWPIWPITPLRTVAPLQALHPLGAIHPLGALGTVRPVNTIRAVGALDAVATIRSFRTIAALVAIAPIRAFAPFGTLVTLLPLRTVRTLWALLPIGAFTPFRTLVALRLIITLAALILVILVVLAAVVTQTIGGEHVGLGSSDDTQVVLGVLVIVFRHHPVTGCMRITGQLLVLLRNMQSRTADLHVRSV